MIKLRWAPYPGSDVVSYKLYRSIIGFTAVIPDLVDVNGKTLILSFDAEADQTITFNGVDPVIDQINAVIEANGGKAFASLNDAANFLVRSDTREAPGSVEIVGGTALADFGLTARVIIEKSEDELLTTVIAPTDPCEVVTFDDLDGTPEDFYRISTVNSQATESLKSDYKQAISFTGSVAIVEGIVTDLQGVRLPDIEVSAKITKMPQCSTTPAFVSTQPVTTLTGEDGRFCLPLLQGAHVLITIEAIGYSKTHEIPEKAFVFLKDIDHDVSHQYPLETKC